MSRPDKKYYKMAEQRELLVFRVCSYIRNGEECEQCPRIVQTSRGEGHRMCRLFAEETIAVILEDFEERKAGEIIQDNAR